MGRAIAESWRARAPAWPCWPGSGGSRRDGGASFERPGSRSDRAVGRRARRQPSDRGVRRSGRSVGLAQRAGEHGRPGGRKVREPDRRRLGHRVRPRHAWRAVRCVRAALPLLRRAEWARIVNFSAHSIQRQSEILPAYTASKAAVASVSKNLAKSLAPEGILVNTVSPGRSSPPASPRRSDDVFVQRGPRLSDPYDVMSGSTRSSTSPPTSVGPACRGGGRGGGLLCLASATATPPAPTSTSTGDRTSSDARTDAGATAQVRRRPSKRPGSRTSAASTFREGLDRLTESLDAEGDLNELGRADPRAAPERAARQPPADRGHLPAAPRHRRRGRRRPARDPRAAPDGHDGDEPAAVAPIPQIRSLRLWESSDPVPPPESATEDTDPRIAETRTRARDDVRRPSRG